MQTTDGYIWLATHGGLVRFDGFQFTTFDLNKFQALGTNRILKLSPDGKNGLWILGERGEVSYYNNSKFKSYTSQIFNLLGDEAYFIKDIFVENVNSIWIASFSNIIHFDGTTFINKTNNKFETDFNFKFFKNSDGTPLVAYYLGIYQLVENEFEEVAVFSDNECTSIALGKDTTFIVGTSSGLYSTNLKTRTKIGNNSFPKDQAINYILFNHENSLWFSFSNGGLWLLKDGVAREFKSPLFNNSQITVLFEDNQKNIWIGTQVYGLIRIEKRLLYSLSLKNKNFNDIIYPILKTKDNSIWIGSNGSGLVNINSKKTDYYNSSNQLSFNQVWALHQSTTGDIYIGSLYSGIKKYRDNVFTDIPELKSLSQNSVYAIYEDSNKSLWLGTNVGVFRYSDEGLEHFSNSNSKLPGNKISAIVEDDDGVLWFATDKGLGYYKSGTIKSITFGKGKATNYIRSIYIDTQNRKWLGTYGGGLIYYYNGNSKVITTEDGLYNNFIHSVIEDKTGNFWLPTNHGIFRVPKKELLDFIEDNRHTLTSFFYTQKDGLASSEFNGGMQPAYSQLEDGTILLPTLKGLVALDLSNFHIHSIVPKVHIENFLVDGKEYSLDSAIVIEPNFSEIKIDFTALDLRNSNNLLFKYMVEGLDEKWSTLKKERFVEYKHLPSGKYKFKVVSKNADGFWNIEGAAIDFEIKATLFETAWFRLLATLFMIFIIAGYFWIRFKLQQKRALQLEETVKERTKSLSVALDESKISQKNESIQRSIAENLNKDKTELLRIVTHNLKNPIGVIRNSSEFIAEDPTDKGTILEMVKIIKSSATHMLKSITQLLQSSEVEDSHFKLEKEEFNFVEAIEKVLDDNKILALKKKQEVQFIAKPQVILINADYSSMLVCIDNLIGNAIKYSETNTAIVVSVVKKKEHILFKVTDEGPGLSKSDLNIAFGKFKKLSARPTGNESSTGLGLSIAKKIIELHGGKIGVNSTLRQGSTFYFELPI